ncbi:EamA family transporter, partial [Streptomyces roseofulvus]|nr:EamA family transporter [Streptomyces roseolus]
LLAVGEQHIASGQAAVLGATQAIIMPLAAWAIGAAGAPKPAAWFGLLAGFVGVIILVRPGGHAIDPIGGAATLASVLLWSVGGALSKRFPLGGVAMTSGIHMILGGLACLAIALVAGEFDGFSLGAVSGASWRGFAYLATFGSLAGFTAFAWLVQIWPP